MARVKGGVVSRKRRKRILKLAKGYYGAKHNLVPYCKEQVMNSYYYAYRDRRQKNVISVNCGLLVSMRQLVWTDFHTHNFHGLKLAEIEVNRK